MLRGPPNENGETRQGLPEIQEKKPARPSSLRIKNKSSTKHPLLARLTKSENTRPTTDRDRTAMRGSGPAVRVVEITTQHSVGGTP
jgi:hypothetical protein